MVQIQLYQYFLISKMYNFSCKQTKCS